MHINIHKYGNGFPIVFFHGWGFDHHIWLPLVPRLMSAYQLLLVDLPGFGHSSLMNWDFFKAMLLNQLPQSFALVGWSMGGLYAMRLAVEEPQRVDFLMCVASSPRFLQDDLWPGISQRVFNRFYKNVLAHPHTALRAFLELQGVTMNATQHPLCVVSPSVSGLELGFKILKTWDFRNELKQLMNPSCFMFGRLDPIVSMHTMDCMQQAYPRFNYVLFNQAAHMPFLSAIDLFIEEIRRFIQ